jgi:Fe-Mn family superoxide dismutase
MNKRTFLKKLGVLGAASLLPSVHLAQSPTQKTPFTLPKLPYNYDALEPHIDKMTMEIHHSKHHQAYINKLNEAVADKNVDNLENLLTTLTEKDTAIRNNGGGHYNHSLFWQLLSPTPQTPMGTLLSLIEKQYGDVSKFKEAFQKAALGVFGSGWAWLIWHKTTGLQICTTPNQDSPAMTTLYPQYKGHTILLGIDVWEHAYYLKYQNKRVEYLTAIWNVVNWQEMGQRLANAK